MRIEDVSFRKWLGLPKSEGRVAHFPQVIRHRSQNSVKIDLNLTLERWLPTMQYLLESKVDGDLKQVF